MLLNGGDFKLETGALSSQIWPPIQWQVKKAAIVSVYRL